ncbi:hypothetical protein LTR08_007646 [Meristemomyces frigidus]|nr:hypothetical protein LTR08_007646 [Meristemomyces frigidus]
MAGQIPQNSVWSAMSYTPPRGRCNHKASLLASACPCLRFMLHPVKAATSFECDGCGHHASFHSLENPAEDAVLKKWAAQEINDNQSQQQATGGAGSKKRKMIAHTAANADDEVQEVPGCWASRPVRVPIGDDEIPALVARKPRKKATGSTLSVG